MQQAFRDCQAWCTPVRPWNKLWKTKACVMYTRRGEVLLDLHLYIRATSFERLSDTSLNLFPYWYVTDHSLWTSFHTDISPMTLLNISIYTYFNDDYFEHILHLYAKDDCFKHLHMHLFQQSISIWTLLRAPISTMIHFEHSCRYMKIRHNFIPPEEKFSWWQ